MKYLFFFLIKENTEFKGREIPLRKRLLSWKHKRTKGTGVFRAKREISYKKIKALKIKKI
jgi:hypothetical protein